VPQVGGGVALRVQIQVGLVGQQVVLGQALLHEEALVAWQKRVRDDEEAGVADQLEAAPFAGLSKAVAEQRRFVATRRSQIYFLKEAVSSEWRRLDSAVYLESAGLETGLNVVQLLEVEQFGAG